MLSHPLSVSVDLLHILLHYAENLGIGRQTIISGTGIDLSIYLADESRIPMPTFHAIWSLIMNRSNDPDFGLHFGEQSHRLLRRHLLYAMMMNCQNVEQAIRKNFQYHHLITDIIKPVIRVEDSLANLTWEMSHPLMTHERHFSESILALLVTMIRFLTEDTFKLKKVHFTHSCPENLAEHERIFQAPLVFRRPCNEIILPKSYLNSPILMANAKIAGDLENLVKDTLQRSYANLPWTEKVARLISPQILQETKPDIEAIAKHLAISKRKLQIKLQSEGTSFRNILEEVRKQISVSYLHDKDASICEIAMLLGFADQSAFQHAFKRWTGKTPGGYRKKIALPSDDVPQ